MSASVEDSTVSSSPRLTQRIGLGEGRYVLLSYHILCSHELPLVFFSLFGAVQLFFAINMDDQASRPPAPAAIGDDHSTVVPHVLLPFLCEQLRSKQLALVKANDEMASLREEMKEKEAAIADLTAQVALRIVLEEDLRAQLMSLNTGCTELNARLSATEVKCAELKAEISELKAQTSVHKARMDNLKAMMKSEKAESAAKHDQVKAQIAELNAEVENIKARTSAKLKAMKAATDKQIKEKLNPKKIAAEVKEQVDNRLLTTIKELKAENAKLRADNQRLKSIL